MLEHAWLTVAPPSSDDAAVDQTFGRSPWAVCVRCGVVGKRHSKLACTVAA